MVEKMHNLPMEHVENDVLKTQIILAFPHPDRGTLSCTYDFQMRDIHVAHIMLG